MMFFHLADVAVYVLSALVIGVQIGYAIRRERHYNAGLMMGADIVRKIWTRRLLITVDHLDPELKARWIRADEIAIKKLCKMTPAEIRDGIE